MVSTLVVGTAFCLAGSIPAGDDQKKPIKGGIEGKVKSVDVEGKKLTITTSQGRERTFTINDETTMVGPNGGKVRRHLKDPRFHEGFPVTIVPEGNTNTADEIHLGFAKDAVGAAHKEAGKSGTKTEGRSETASKTSKSAATPPVEATTTSRNKQKEAAKQAEDDDEDEILGHVKSFDHTRRLLVITLLNGKSRSFILAQDVPVHVKGTTAASRQGLSDPQLKAGAAIVVVTDEGGRNVKELKITPASEIKKKAG
jgi:hypothetical protein